MMAVSPVPRARVTLTPLALGCEALGGVDWGTVNVREGREAVRAALDLGIRVFDTADAYGLGRSEEELGHALGADRHAVTIVTKGGIRWSDAGSGRARTWRDASAGHIAAAIDGSLRRLGVDAITLYLVHWPDGVTGIDEILECLESARVAGKVLAFGLSNFPADIVRVALQDGRIAAIEGPLSLLSEGRLTREYAEARTAGADVLTYGPLAQGLLTGRYAADAMFDTTDRRHRLPHFTVRGRAPLTPILDAVRRIADEAGCAPAQVAIRWALQSGVTSSVIFGAKSPRQVLENQAAIAWTLTPAQVAELDAARAAAGLLT